MVTLKGNGADAARVHQQQEKGMMTYPSTPWMRGLAKAPIYLWRMGLGPLLGQMMMVIATTGRKSGLPRYTMTEYHDMEGRKIVPCAFGQRSDWYKNIQADPRVTIHTSCGVEHVKARRITDGDELLQAYHLLHKRNPTMLDAYLATVDVRSDPVDVVAKKDRITIMTFDPTDEPTPPPLAVDLQWVWGVIGGALLLGWVFGRLAGARRRR